MITSVDSGCWNLFLMWMLEMLGGQNLVGIIYWRWIYPLWSNSSLTCSSSFVRIYSCDDCISLSSQYLLVYTSRFINGRILKKSNIWTSTLCFYLARKLWVSWHRNVQHVYQIPNSIHVIKTASLLGKIHFIEGIWTFHICNIYGHCFPFNEEYLNHNVKSFL